MFARNHLKTVLCCPNWGRFPVFKVLCVKEQQSAFWRRRPILAVTACSGLDPRNVKLILRSFPPDTSSAECRKEREKSKTRSIYHLYFLISSTLTGSWKYLSGLEGAGGKERVSQGGGPRSRTFSPNPSFTWSSGHYLGYLIDLSKDLSSGVYRFKFTGPGRDYL